MSMKPKRRHYLSKKDTKRLIKEFRDSYPRFPLSPSRVEEVEFDEFTIYVLDGVPCIADKGDVVFPTLYCLLRVGHEWIDYVVVDRGATLALARGAHLMAPGVKGIEGEFGEGSIVAVVDLDSGKPVAIVKALVNSQELRRLVESRGKGRVALNIHRPGDKVWRACEILRQA